jgi:hypothetical protein
MVVVRVVQGAPRDAGKVLSMAQVNLPSWHRQHGSNEKFRVIVKSSSHVSVDLN